MAKINWSIGVTVAARGQGTLQRTLTSIEHAGFPKPRVFADGAVDLPDGFATSLREPQVGGWPNFWLAITELVARDPNCDIYLIVQDDVVFSRGVSNLVEGWRIPDDCGVFSLFCPACNNGPLGFHKMPSGYGMASAQALAFPRERVFEFLAHPWTVNHRRSSPKSKHFRGDGLHHIDGAVGEWCKRAELSAYTHSPSLSQHIGVTSIMYPQLRSKLDRRFADCFPGENVDAATLYPLFDQLRQTWCNAGGNVDWCLPGHVWAVIAGMIEPGSRTLEFGSGLSTKLFLDAKCDHTSLEHDQTWHERLTKCFPECSVAVQLCELKGNPLWYSWTPPFEPFDLILVDGPTGAIGRMGLLSSINRLIHDNSVIVFDDVRRPAEAKVCEALRCQLGWQQKVSTAGNYGFAVLAKSFDESTSLGLPHHHFSEINASSSSSALRSSAAESFPSPVE